VRSKTRKRKISNAGRQESSPELPIEGDKSPEEKEKKITCSEND
jgi:hypothetical protein